MAPKEIHPNFFTFPKTKLRDTGRESGYEWKNEGNGKWVRVKKEQKVENEIVLNEVLNQAINFLREEWFKENVGIVAATLVEGDMFVSATSLYVPSENRWIHAEAAALQRFQEEFGRKPKESSTMVVTLSPCLLESKSRLGESCSHKIMESGISRVRFGCLDTKQTPLVDIFEQIGIEAQLIGNEEQRKICDSLYRLFDELYKPEGRFFHLLGKFKNPWAEVKKLMGLEPFEI